jgi:hypothetical protein
MDPYRLTVYLHLVCAVLLMGMALFWLIMLVALKQKFGAASAAEWLVEANRARWPHVIVPRRFRLPLPWISWGLIAVLVLTGTAALHLQGAPPGVAWKAKLGLVAGIIVVQALMSRRPVAWTIQAGFWITLAAIVASGLGIRG